MPRVPAPAALSTETTGRMGHKAAHKVLKKLRDEMRTPNRIAAESRDLSDRVEFGGRTSRVGRPERTSSVRGSLASRCGFCSRGTQTSGR